MKLMMEASRLQEAHGFAEACRMQFKVHGQDAQDNEREVVAEIAWNLSTLLSCHADLVDETMQELWDRLPLVDAIQTDSLPVLTMLHRNRALSLAAAFNIMMNKHETVQQIGSSASNASSAGSLEAVASDSSSLAAAEDDHEESLATVLQNLTALQMFHVKRAQALNSEYRDRQTCTGWF